MKKVFYLSTCDTCRRIMKDVGVDDSFDLQDVKSEALSLDQIEWLRTFTESYEALINKRARKLKAELALHPIRSDEDYRDVLLKDYTFLKRPIFAINEQLFIGNSKEVIQNLKTALK